MALRSAVARVLALWAGCLLPTRAAGKALVGVYYTSWMSGAHNWAQSWDKPLLGEYNSMDDAVIEQHHKWLACAGADFVVLDWSNNIQCAFDYSLNPSASTCGDPAPRFVEDASIRVFEVFRRLGGIKIAILTGSPATPRDYQGGGRMWAASQKIYDMFVASPRYGDLYFHHQGKPLLLDYVGTPVPFLAWGKVDPEWDDGRFTVRHVTGFLSNQEFMLNGAGGDVSVHGYWSWEDRVKNVWSLNPNGSPEAAVVTAASRGDCVHGPSNAGGSPWGCPGVEPRKGGQTFNSRFSRAIAAGVDIVMIQSFNEWMGTTEELDPERSNDIEPSNALGFQYLQLLAANVAQYKASKGVPVNICI